MTWMVRPEPRMAPVLPERVRTEEVVSVKSPLVVVEIAPAPLPKTTVFD